MATAAQSPPSPASLVDLRELESFARVADSGSLSEAAKALGVPVSTVSRRITALEARLGVQLLSRSTRQVRVTPLGAVYRETCARALAALEEGERTLRQLEDAPRGTLHVTSPHALGEAALGAVLGTYARAFPDVTVAVTLSDEVFDLAERGIDVALRFGRRNDPRVVARVVGASPNYLCASPAYVMRHGAPRKIEDLAAHPMLCFGVTGRAPPTVPFVRAGRVIAHPVQARAVINSFPLLLGLCRGDQGIAVLPKHYADPDLGRGTLVRILADVEVAPAQVLVARPAGVRATRATRAFVELVREELARMFDASVEG